MTAVTLDGDLTADVLPPAADVLLPCWTAPADKADAAAYADQVAAAC